MSELSLEEKCKLAATLVEQSPPGEVNDVINSIRTIVADDETLMTHVRPSLRAYNLAQLTPIEHEAAEAVPAHTSLLSEAAILPGTSGEGERYVDVQGKRSFAFDHITLTVSDYEEYKLPEEEETFCAELAKSLGAYAKNHFPSGSHSVSTSQYPLLPPAPEPERPAVASESEEPSATSEAEPEVASEATETPEEAANEEPKEIVTDVVPEQVGSGEEEPAPTPAAGDAPKEEVDQPGGIEKVDEEIQEVQEEEDASVGAGGAEVEKGEEGLNRDVAKVEEDEVKVDEPAVAPPVEERKQERVENPIYTLEIVGNRYNTSNFWTGRWRTRWIVDQAAKTVQGTINVDVHYYEQGNVQLATNHSTTFPCPAQANGDQSIASQIVTTISKIETEYQLELNDVYDQLGEKAFRALRRALPVTRQKMDWDKVGGYSLGSEVSKSRS